MCPDLAEDVSKSSDWIIKFFPTIIKYFRDEIIDHINPADFNKMVSNKDFQYESFQEHFKYFQNLNSVSINYIFSLVSIRSSDYKEKTQLIIGRC